MEIRTPPPTKLEGRAEGEGRTLRDEVAFVRPPRAVFDGEEESACALTVLPVAPLRPSKQSLEGDDVIRIARTWIGTPYIHQASVKHAGCDCLGLLRGVWRELHGDEPQEVPPYSGDWAEASGEETLANALRVHLSEIDKRTIAPGDIAVFRMLPHMPAKHCGIIASSVLPPRAGEVARSAEGGECLTLIHARQNKRVSEEPFSPFWSKKLAYAFRL